MKQFANEKEGPGKKPASPLERSTQNLDQSSKKRDFGGFGTPAGNGYADPMEAARFGHPGATALLQSGGGLGHKGPRPLPGHLVVKAQRLLGADLADVVIEEDPSLAEQGKLGVAEQGRRIRLAPGGLQDLKLIWHEMVHIVQQRQGTRGPDDATQAAESKVEPGGASSGSPERPSSANESMPLERQTRQEDAAVTDAGEKRERLDAEAEAEAGASILAAGGKFAPQAAAASVMYQDGASTAEEEEVPSEDAVEEPNPAQLQASGERLLDGYLEEARAAQREVEAKLREALSEPWELFEVFEEHSRRYAGVKQAVQSLEREVEAYRAELGSVTESEEASAAYTRWKGRASDYLEYSLDLIHVGANTFGAEAEVARTSLQGYYDELGRVSARLEKLGAEAVQRGLLSEDALKLRLEAFRALVVEHETARASEQSLSATSSLAQQQLLELYAFTLSPDGNDKRFQAPNEALTSQSGVAGEAGELEDNGVAEGSGVAAPESTNAGGMLEDTEVAAAAVGVVTVAAIFDRLTKDQQTELRKATLRHIEIESGAAGLRLIQVLVDQGAANSVLREVANELKTSRKKDDRVYWERHVDKVTAKLESKALSHQEAGSELRLEYDRTPVQAGNAKGRIREESVAELVGGTVSREKISAEGVGSTDVDVIGPSGEMIAVGGPAKANDLAKLGQKLNILKRVAGERGVPAQAYFSDDTPQTAIDVARKQLGNDAVFIFPNR
ncbi:MAG: hypothetical protein RBU37_23775 [Myxococcota bacterium]|jgi:hypothetical protein|nr:hypothetical protein [Myxococcota bacterium]